ncbi:MAG: cyclic-di-AMP receptor [Armatimonadetes bacterium]|nr:cyclic-di-AMP receptor [Armatimonadota bacterium]
MKLLIAIVPNRLARRVRERLCADGHGYTELSGSGGLFREGNATLLIGLDDAQVEPVLAALRELCQPRQASINLPGADLRAYADPASGVETVEIGGLHAFVLGVEQMVHL